jgi:hypothetical protein
MTPVEVNLQRSSDMPPKTRAAILACLASFVVFACAQGASAREGKGDEAAGRNAVEVLSSNEGKATFSFLRPEGARVAKGQVVCELEGANHPGLSDQLAQQSLVTKSAEAAYRNAELTREVAEIAVTEYVEGIFKQDLAVANGEIAVEESGLRRCEDRLGWAKRMIEKGYLSQRQVEEEQLVLDKAKAKLEQAKARKDVLEKYTRGKTIKELKSEVEKARADELRKKVTLEREQAVEARLKKAAEAFRITAPISGNIQYGRPIDASTTVIKGQLLFRIVP